MTKSTTGDKDLKTPVNSKIVKSAKKFKTFIIYKNSIDKKIINFKKSKVKLIKVSLTENKNFNLKKILLLVKNLGYSRILLESGITLTSNFLKENLVDDFKIFISEKRIKSNGLLNFRNYLLPFIKKRKFKVENVNLSGNKLISCRIK